jgi:FkbM family methyltransferase
MNKISLLQELRQKLSKDSIYFIQVGASDGDTNDIAKFIIQEQDKGIFIEPSLYSFNKLIFNKKQFLYCTFLNLAITPEDIQSEVKLSILSEDELEQGSSLISELPTSYRIIKNNTIKTMSIKNLIDTYNINNIDMFFCDTEGMDHLLIQKLLTIIQPKILIFESFFWMNNDKEVTLSNDIVLNIPSRNNIKQILIQNHYDYIDFNDSVDDKSEDIIAWNTTLLNHQVKCCKTMPLTLE